MEGNGAWWVSVKTPPNKPGEYLVYGPDVGQSIGGKYDVWFWDGLFWISEGGTERADVFQMLDAYWTDLPEYHQRDITNCGAQ